MADPVRITVMWHKECGEGRNLAGAIYSWFRGDPEDPGEAGRGIPVHYRCEPKEPCGSAFQDKDCNSPKAEEPPGYHIAVPLVDEHMVVQREWRSYLERLVSTEPPSVDLMVPVALDAVAYQLPYRVNRLNFLRLQRAVDPANWSWEQRSRIRRERLLSLLTQVVARELLGLPTTQAQQDAPPKAKRLLAPPQIRVFISHAKSDGAGEAEILRTAILASGQLQAFYDESDLPIGYEFERLLVDAAGAGESAETQAMVALYSDAYPTRPWCQRELRQARKPRVADAASGAASRCWRVKPLVVVAKLAGAETRMLGEVGNAPLIAWDPDRIGRIVDTLLREILLLRYNEARAHALLARQDQAGLHALNCTPDALLAMEVVRGSGGGLTELLIPSPGLANDARLALEELMSLAGEKVRIRTFDEAEIAHS